MLAHLKTRSPNHLADTLLHLAGPAAFAALLAVSASAANAAECVNGYRTLPNQVIFLCDDGAALSERQALLSEPAAPAAAPVVSGTAGAPSSRAMLADDIADCQPGMYRMMYWENGSMMLSCK
jgi:hypothetical protein